MPMTSDCFCYPLDVNIKDVKVPELAKELGFSETNVETLLESIYKLSVHGYIVYDYDTYNDLNVVVSSFQGRITLEFEESNYKVIHGDKSYKTIIQAVARNDGYIAANLVYIPHT